MSTMQNVSVTPAFDPDSRYGGDRPPVVVTPKNKLDSDENLRLLSKLVSWRHEARELLADERREQYLDADFYDGKQYTDEDWQALIARGQAPLVYNLVGPAVDWIVGTERRTRVDWKILPRGSEDVEAAQAKQALVKYVADANNLGWERSAAFKDAAIVGVGWTEEFLRSDDLEEEIGIRRVDWKCMWRDPFARSLDLSDCRYLIHERFIDLDYALAIWPERADQLRAAAVSYADVDLDSMDDEIDVPAMFFGTPTDRHQRPFRYLGTTGSDRHARQRVRVAVTWFRRPMVSKKIRAKIADYGELNGVIYDTSNPEHAAAQNKGAISLIDSVTDAIWYGVWVPGQMATLLQLGPSPFRHNRLPFTPYWCYRGHRDGAPYGVVRRVRDPQEDYNKRRSKALHAASANRVMYESDAVNEEDEDDFLDEVGRPDAQLRLNPNGLNKVKIETGLDVARTHMELMAESKQQVYEGSGVTRENMGQDTAAQSGRAILAKQQQGAVVTAELFDNYRLGIQLSGRKTLSLVEQFMTAPKQIRILGPDKQDEFLTINEPYIDEATGEVMFKNDVTRGMADFVVDQQDYRETVRMAMAEQLFETIGRLPPEVALQLLDLAVELTDIPNKDEIVRRIRSLNGQTPQPVDPAQAEQQARQQQSEQMMAELDMRERAARIGKDEAAADNLRAQAQVKRVEGKARAMDTAGLIASALPLAPEADRLWQAPE